MNEFSIFTIHNQYHLTQDLTDIEKNDLKTCLKNICVYLSQNNIVCIYCKVFLQDIVLLQDLIDEFKQSGQDPIIIPLEYPSVTGSKMSGINLFGINNGELDNFERKIVSDMDCVSYSYKGLKYFHGMHLFQDSSSAFHACQSSLYSFHLKPTSIIRTWFYLNQIFKNYPDFNRNRNQFFDANNIRYDKDSTNLPASTCIEGSFSDKHMIQLYAVDIADSDSTKKRIYNISQNEADGDTYLFQPAFSRAMLFDNGCYKELQISGTASVGSDGKTLHINDSYQQIKTTLCNVSNLLKEAEMSWEHICECTIFFSNADMYQWFEKACEELEIKNLKGVSVVCNICREDLLFEIDGIAKKNYGN